MDFSSTVDEVAAEEIDTHWQHLTAALCELTAVVQLRHRWERESVVTVLHSAFNSGADPRPPQIGQFFGVLPCCHCCLCVCCRQIEIAWCLPQSTPCVAEASGRRHWMETRPSSVIVLVPGPRRFHSAVPGGRRPQHGDNIYERSCGKVNCIHCSCEVSPWFRLGHRALSSIWHMSSATTGKQQNWCASNHNFTTEG